MRTAALARPRGVRLRSALTPGPRLRRRALVVLVLAALLAAGYLLWLRDSSLVAVERVTVVGATGENAARLRAALTSTAESMTTLHVDRERLERATAPFPSVARVEATPDFPDALTIEVVEHRPVAILDADGASAPVAADGTILAGLSVTGELPAIELSGAPPQGRLTGAERAAAAVAGAAPAAIARRLERIGDEGGARGLVAEVADGPELLFGTAGRLAAKWAAAVRVLADEDAGGAAYIDVRLPDRPAVGGLPADPVQTYADPYADSYAEPSTDPYGYPRP